MSFISGLHNYEECISDEMIATINFQDKKLEQCTMKKEHIEENLVKIQFSIQNFVNYNICRSIFLTFLYFTGCK